MKTKTLFYMALMAVMTTLAACSQDDDMQQDAAPVATPIEFEITDGGYGGNDATRAVEEGYYTRFTAGDECGLYIVNGSTLKAKNVKLTASEENGKLTWKAADGAISDVTENSKYFLYYPYPDDNEKIEEINNTEMSSAADKDTDFFENLISGWEVQPDQSNHDNYTASDLMTAKGTATYDGSTLKLSFKLDHRMALAEIVAPVKVGFSSGVSCYMPYQAEEWKYRFIVNPGKMADGKSISGEIGGKKFAIKSEKLNQLTAGQYKTFKVGSSYYVESVPGGTSIYHVYDYNGLKAWAEKGSSFSCKLEADITMPTDGENATNNWTPVDVGDRATFDGNGHTITGLKVNTTGSYVGFIGRLDGGTVKNLTLENVNITGIDVTTGGVAGYCNGGTIENCHITGTGRISVTEDSYSGEIGGIVGSNSKGTILACHVSKEYSVGTDATMAQTFLTGGIAGKNSGGTIKGCYALCKLTGNYVGGICGSNSSSYDDTESSYIACYSNCSYNASGNAGGILGRSSGSPTFTQCYYQNGVGSGVGGESENKHGVEAMFNWTDQDYLRDNVTSNMNNTLGEDFGYKYIVNNPISQDEPLILVKKQ